MAVDSLDDNLEHAIVVGIGRPLEIGGRDQVDHAGGGVDRERRTVGTARNPVCHRVARIGIGGVHLRHDRAALGHVNRRDRPAAVRRDDRRVVTVEDRDLEAGVENETTGVGGPHDDVLFRRGFEVEQFRARDGHHARRSVDRETTAGIAGRCKAVAQHIPGIGVAANHLADNRAPGRILADAPRRQHQRGRRLVDVGDGDRKQLLVDFGAIGNLNDDLVLVRCPGAARLLVIRGRDEMQLPVDAVDREQRGIGSSDDGVDKRGSGIRINGLDRGDDRCVFTHRHGGAGQAVVGNNSGRFVDVGDREPDGLGVGQGPVGGLDIDLVDIVAVGVCRCFEVSPRDDREGTVLRVDGKA